MRYQRQSEVPKKGEPADHKLASMILKEHIESHDRRFWCQDGMRYTFPPEFILDKKIEYSFHDYDLAVFFKHLVMLGGDGLSHCIALIELDGKTDYKIELPDGTIVKGKRTRHDKKQQKINDGIAEDFIAQYYPQYLFFRIEKGDCFYPEYLDKTLAKLWEISG